MIKAIWRAAAVGRLGMFAAILSIVTLARVAGAIREGDQWVSSESQATIAVVVLGLVLPVFVCMLATALLRGEHAPWSWGLARPISRLRVIGSLVALDVATIAACMFAAWLVLDGFGGMGGLLGGTRGGTTLALVVCLYANLYMLAAIAGIRTPSTVRAASVAMLATALIVASAWSLASFAVETTLGSFGLQERWALGFLVEGVVGWGGPFAFNEAHTWWLLSALLLATAAQAGPALAFLHTARLTPGPVHLRRAAMQSVALVGLSACLLVSGWVLAYRSAPSEARKGDITLRVVPRTSSPDLTVRSVGLHYRAGHVNRFAASLPPADARYGTRTFVELSPGRFEACVVLRLHQPAPNVQPQVRAGVHCVPVTVTEDPQQVLTLDLTPSDVPPAR